MQFFTNPKTAVVASASNFPDGLCGGPLAAAMNAPLILTVNNKTSEAVAYTNANAITAGYVLGGESVMSNQSVLNVYGLSNLNEIIVVK